MLNHIKIEALRPKDRAYSDSEADSRGLSIFIQPNGSRWWRFRYRFEGKANMLSLGVYPDEVRI